MSEKNNVIFLDDLLKRWDIDLLKLQDFINAKKLPCFYNRILAKMPELDSSKYWDLGIDPSIFSASFNVTQMIRVFPKTKKDFEDVFFKIDDILEFEKNDYPNKLKFNETVEISLDRRFIKKNDMWEISFDGESKFFKDCKPIQTITEILKRPYEDPLSCDLLYQNTDGVNMENPSILNDNLNINEEISEHTKKDKAKMKKAIELAYIEYLKDLDGQQDRWKMTKDFAKKQYGILTNDDDGKISFSYSKHRTKTSKSVKSISQDRARFLHNIEGFKTLHDHFTQYLQIAKGKVLYNPPDGSPPWNISS